MTFGGFQPVNYPTGGGGGGPWAQVGGTGGVIEPLDPTASLQAAGGVASGAGSVALGASAVASSAGEVQLGDSSFDTFDLSDGGATLVAQDFISLSEGKGDTFYMGSGEGIALYANQNALALSANDNLNITLTTSGSGEILFAGGGGATGRYGGDVYLSDSIGDYIFLTPGTMQLADATGDYLTCSAGVVLSSAEALEVNDVAGSSIVLDGTGNMTLTSMALGFFAATPAAQPTVTGSRGGNAALGSLLTSLASLGLVIDGSTP